MDGAGMWPLLCNSSNLQQSQGMQRNCRTHSSIGNFKSKEEEKRPLGKKESSIYLNFEFPHTPDGDDVAGCFLIESSECQSLLQLSLSSITTT